MLDDVDPAPPSPRRRSRRPLAVTAALALAAAAGVIAWRIWELDPAKAEGRRQLLALADTIRAASYETTTGPWTHRETLIWADNGRLSLPFSQHMHLWIAADGTGRWVRSSHPYQPTAVDLSSLATDFSHPYLAYRSGWDGAESKKQNPSLESDDLPTPLSADDVIDRLRVQQQRTNQSLPALGARAVASRHNRLPDTVERSTLLRTLTELDAFVYLGVAADRAGRPGQAFQATVEGENYTIPSTFWLLFDSHTGELLADERDDIFGYQYTLHIRRERSQTNTVRSGEAPCPRLTPSGEPDTSCPYAVGLKSSRLPDRGALR